MVKKYITDVKCVGLICNNYIWFNWTHKLNWHFLFNWRSDDSDGGGGDDDNNSNNIIYYY